MAASAEGRAIDPQSVIQFCRAAIAASGGVLLIEGVGGVLVPLDDYCTTLDVMAALRLPLIFVGGGYLGAISHILSGIDALLYRGLDLRAVVVSETRGSTVALDATLATLAHFVTIPLLAMRRSDRSAENDAAFARLAALL